MEESSPARHPSRVREVVWTLVLMMVSFVGGVFVGLHPNWIPISVPLPSPGPAATPDNGQPSEIGPPTTMPTTQEATTQPS
jgi:hypothetical protein